MSLYEILIENWGAAAPTERPGLLLSALERGQVIYCPRLRFQVEPRETALFTPAILGSAKNASLDPRGGRLGGTVLKGHEAETLRAFMQRFSLAAGRLVDRLLPAYRGWMVAGRASFRPAEIAGRASSWRKDDTRLHIDSFPATPSGGHRILRLFTNVNPDGRPRTWRVGGDFESVAERFAPQLAPPLPFTGHLIAWLRLTKSPRTPYDSLMLQLHDAMKADEDFQRRSPQEEMHFPAGSTWIAFTDQVSHAATAGQYQLEQTFMLPVQAMVDEGRSPLRVLERLKGRTLT